MVLESNGHSVSERSSCGVRTLSLQCQTVTDLMLQSDAYGVTALSSRERQSRRQETVGESKGYNVRE
jgi:hypothetical protein